MVLRPASFNLVMGWLSVRDRSRVAACSTKSAADMLSLYGAVRIGGGKVLGDDKLLNLFDLSGVKLTEAQLEQLMAGQLVPSGRWCEPTGVTLSGFVEGLDLDRELPGYVADVLSRLVVLRAVELKEEQDEGSEEESEEESEGNICGPLAALVPRLAVNRIQVLDLWGCKDITGQLDCWIRPSGGGPPEPHLSCAPV